MNTSRLLVGLLFCSCAAPPVDPGAPPVVAADPIARTGVNPEPPIDPGAPFPIPDWPLGTPAQVGLEVAKLDEAATVAEGNGSFCLLVIRKGLLVYERYFAGTDAATPHPSWSLAKSYSGTLVGIAIDRGDIHGLDDKAADYVTQWQGTDRANITVRDLVSMTSGLKWSMFQDYVEMATIATDDTKFAVALPLAEPPGSKWVYHNGAVQILEPLFRGATGMTIEQYAQKHLWSKIGMQASWAHDGASHPTPYANVLATCRDHARLGYLYLHKGRWGSEQVVSSAWVTQATTPSQAFNRAYGFLFWLNGETPAYNAMMEPWPERMVPFAPKDLFAARGFGNQFIDVLPSEDLIVVRFGKDPLAGNIADIFDDSRFGKHDAILRPVLEALP